MTRLSSQKIVLPSVSRAGTVTGLSVGFLTVTLYSPSPSGFWNCFMTAGFTPSTRNSTPGPASNPGRPVAEQVTGAVSLESADQEPLPSFDHGDSRRPCAIVQPSGMALA